MRRMSAGARQSVKIVLHTHLDEAKGQVYFIQSTAPIVHSSTYVFPLATWQIWMHPSYLPRSACKTHLVLMLDGKHMEIRAWSVLPFDLFSSCSYMNSSHALVSTTTIWPTCCDGVINAWSRLKTSLTALWSMIFDVSPIIPVISCLIFVVLVVKKNQNVPAEIQENPPALSHGHLYLFNTLSVEQLQALYLTSKHISSVLSYLYVHILLKIFANINWTSLLPN